MGTSVKQLTPFSITSPGFFGANTQDSPIDMPKEFALTAINCIIDKSGRIASRKGWAAANTSNSDLSTSNVTCIGEVIENGGTATTVCSGGAFLFKLGGTTLTTLTYGGGGAAPTISASNWQFCQLNGIGIFWQRGYDPLIYDPGVSTTTYRRLNEKTGTAGTVQQANTAISAFGRIWCADLTADKNTIYFSDIITPQVWSGGTSGSLDLRDIWPTGGDEIVALAAHNNFLIIFGKVQTLIYAGADDPLTMQLSDHLDVGCIARDSVQNTGEDIIFLSRTGVRSLMRTIQEKSVPMRDISHNTRDEIIEHLNSETLANIKSGYNPHDAFYILTLPVATESYVFDTRQYLQDDSARITTWSTCPKSFCFTKSGLFYMGQAGFIGSYSTYLDNASTYRMSYYSPWIDFGNPVQTSILKKLSATIIGSSDQSIILKWAWDFSLIYQSQTIVLANAGTSAEFGIAEYGIGEFGATIYVNEAKAQGGGSGELLQIGMETVINGSKVSIQKIDIQTKEGRI